MFNQEEHPMTVKELNYAVIIYETGSFSAASEILFISQSALSQSIKKLETELGFTLFLRNGARLKPTAACSVFIRSAKKVLDSWDSFTKEMQLYAETKEAELRVAAPAGLCKNLIPLILPILNKEHPELKITIIEERSNTAEQLVMDDMIDLAVVQEPLFLPKIERIPCYRSEYLLAVPNSHEFAKKHPYHGMNCLERIDIHELKDAEFALIKHPRNDCYIEELLQKANFSPTVTMRSSIWNNIKDYIKTGKCVGFLDEIVARYEPDDDKISYYRLAEYAPKRNLCAVYCPGKELTTAAKWFIDALSRYPHLPE